MRKIIVAEFWVLLLGMLFAWGNFGYELKGWLEVGTCTTGCSVGAPNPFLTPCFGGALFFTIAFILSAMLLKKSNASMEVK